MVGLHKNPNPGFIFIIFFRFSFRQTLYVLGTGTDVTILIIISSKKAFFAQTCASLCKKLIITLIFEKTPLLPKICENSRKL
jgi:hypothetical protein